MCASTTLLNSLLTLVAGWLLRERLGGVAFTRKVRHCVRKWWLSEGLMAHILPVTLAYLALGACTSFAGEDRTMEFVETYKGHTITVTTTRASDGGWTASARIGEQTITVEPDAPDKPGGKSFRSEEDAKAAALRAAVAAIDRSRVSIGKP
jgi:hypothetical protein